MTRKKKPSQTIKVDPIGIIQANPANTADGVIKISAVLAAIYTAKVAMDAVEDNDMLTWLDNHASLVGAIISRSPNVPAILATPLDLFAAFSLAVNPPLLLTSMLTANEDTWAQLGLNTPKQKLHYQLMKLLGQPGGPSSADTLNNAVAAAQADVTNDARTVVDLENALAVLQAQNPVPTTEPEDPHTPNHGPEGSIEAQINAIHNAELKGQTDVQAYVDAVNARDAAERIAEEGRWIAAIVIGVTVSATMLYASDSIFALITEAVAFMGL
jgi:citrate lyase beta subunit